MFLCFCTYRSLEIVEMFVDSERFWLIDDTFSKILIILLVENIKVTEIFLILKYVLFVITFTLVNDVMFRFCRRTVVEIFCIH